MCVYSIEFLMDMDWERIIKIKIKWYWLISIQVKSSQVGSWRIWSIHTLSCPFAAQLSVEEAGIGLIEFQEASELVSEREAR